MHKLVVICPTMSQPRFHKRAQQLKLLFNLDIYAFSRGLYEINEFPEGLTPTSLGRIKDRSYVGRISKLIRAIFIIRRNLKRADKLNTFFYVFSLDALVIARLLGLRRGFYEVGDIRIDRSKRSFFSTVERILTKNLEAIVVTSPKFVDEIKKLDGDLEDREVYCYREQIAENAHKAASA